MGVSAGHKQQEIKSGAPIQGPVGDERRISQERRFATTLVAVQRKWRQGVEHEVRQACGHSFALLSPLVALSRFGDGKRNVGLAELVGIEPASLVRVIQELERLGLIERRDQPGDGRAKLIHLTQSGVEMAGRVEAVLLGYRAKVLRDAPSERLAAGLAMFNRMLEALADLSSKGPRRPHNSEEST